MAEAQRLKGLEDENRQLSQLLADLIVDEKARKVGHTKKRLELPGLSVEVAFVQAQHGLSERLPCKLLEAAGRAMCMSHARIGKSRRARSC